jgi:FkbM family methyltransferase
MISYSQNQEDVVLFRLVQLVSEGFYVDVGAAHPVLDNVTYALYEAGWRGINIEPMKREADLLREVRPRDITCQVAAGNTPGLMTLFAAPLDNRGATTADKELVAAYERDGQAFDAFDVEVVRLDEILEQNKIEVIHILKIDVEGFEREVLEGSSIEKYRPWVLVIEATRPNSTVDVSAEWEKLVLDSGYVKTLFDGLNKFYVRTDMTDLVELMSTPANVFDRWKTSEVNNLTQVIDGLIQQAETLQDKISVVSKNLSVESSARDVAFHKVEEYVKSLESRAEIVEEYVKSLESRAEIAEEYASSLEKRLAEIDNKDSSH